jgi:plasmid stabilization system protein ParE
VRRVRILASARRDIADIYRYIVEASGSVAVAKRFTRQLTDQCRHIGSLHSMLGRARSDLEEGIRCIPFKNYMIFFRYLDDVVEIVNVIEGHRDIDAMFRKNDQ